MLKILILKPLAHRGLLAALVAALMAALGVDQQVFNANGSVIVTNQHLLIYLTSDQPSSALNYII